jgi:hypothetical protein
MVDAAKKIIQGQQWSVSVMVSFSVPASGLKF